ncbi:hypothetical protein IJG98_02190 [Candidatus Saccharibacteria bacterium]|nr:hypothetical protein [Candidatus Saccharibacteria bacterium]
MDRKERLKAELWEDPFLEQQYEEEKIEAEPSKMRALGRKMMDVLGVKSVKSELMRDREAMGEALREYREEKAERRRMEAVRREEERQEAALRQEREKAAREEALERMRLESDMSKARKHFEQHKQEKFEGQRVQEMLEKELNSRLTTVESLEEAVMASEEGVAKRSVEFEGEEIPVYDLTGKPFEMISHAVDYRYANWSMGNADIGNKTAQELLEHPEVWERTREEVMQEEGYGTRREDAKGDVISTSYVNSETNIDTRVSKFGGYYTLCYGFERLPADSLLYVTSGDAGSSNTGGKGETLLDRSDVEGIKNLEGAGGAPGYNEVVLRRYDESGEALLPSYMIAEDGHITEEMLRHAKYFGVPIVNIERGPYDRKLETRAKEAIAEVSEESSYEEITQAIEVLRRAPRFYHAFNRIDSVGRKRDKDAMEARGWRMYPEGMREAIIRLEDLEFKKRVDFIEEKLKEATETGKMPRDLVYFAALERPATGMYGAPGNCDSLTVIFRQKGEARAVETTFYDGEHVLELEEAMARGYLEEEDLEQADSSYYQRLKPLVEAYNAR